MRKDLFKDIQKNIIDELKQFNSLNSDIERIIVGLGMTFRRHTERSVAGFLTTHILSKATKYDTSRLHEAALSIDQTLRSKIQSSLDSGKTKFFDDNPGKVKEYGIMEVDGFLNIKHKDWERNLFIEYKIDRESKNRFLEFAKDFLKFLAYSYYAKKENLDFMYVLLEPGRGSRYVIIKPTQIIQFKKAYLKILDENRVLIFNYDNINVESVNTNIEDILLNQYVIANLHDCFNDENYNIDKNIIDKYKKIEERNWFIKRNIYGAHVSESYKLRKNSEKIVDLWKKIDEQVKKKIDFNDSTISRIEILIASLREIDTRKTDAKKKMLNQMSNWLLAVIEAGSMHFHNEIYNKILGKNKTIFDIREVNEMGQFMNSGTKVNGYNDMVGTLLKNFKDNKIYKKDDFYLILFHIKEIYNNLFTYDQDKKMAFYNEEYISYKSKNRLTRDIKKSYKIISKRTKVKEADITPENISNKILEFITLFIKK